MLNREEALDVIQRAYGARVRGDREELARYWTQDAHFEIVGDQTLLRDVALTAPSALHAISELIDRFEFSDLRLLDAVVDGESVAVRWAVTIKAEGKDPVHTQLFDLIKFGEGGKIRSLVQFVDTALIRHLTD